MVRVSNAENNWKEDLMRSTLRMARYALAALATVAFSLTSN
jgi:hypothetical protein